MNNCKSIKSSSEPNLPCLLKTKNNNKYCALHMLNKNNIDFKESNKKPIIKLNKKKKAEDCLVKKENIQGSLVEIKKENKLTKYIEDNDSLLDMKLLILQNENIDELSNLIGPIFYDLTLSDDDIEPITYDAIWILKDNVKIPGSINKYFLFSYLDSKNKIKCLSIFSIYDMYLLNKYVHPITLEEIPEEAINRCKKLIKLYISKINLFEKEITPELKIKNNLNSLFNKFHIHSIFFEENWIINITKENDVIKIIKETHKLIKNNLTVNIKLSDDLNKDLNDLKLLLIDEWNQLFQSDPRNQTSIWIIGASMYSVIPEVKTKYPNLLIY